MFERSQDAEVAILRLCHGKASALDLELCEALERAVADEERSSARAVVLTGTGGIFSAGVDLTRLVAGGPGYVARFLPALDALLLRLLRFEKPLIGALNGHAIAGGALLAGACDVRLLARGNATLGVPELKVGVPFPLLAVELAREMFPSTRLNEALYSGRLYRAEECAALGLVDELVEPEALSARALERARELGSIPPASFALTKRLRRLPALETFDRHGARAAAEGLAAWSAPDVLAAVERYVQRTLRR